MDRMVARVRKGSKDTQLFYILEKGGGSSITQRQWLIFSTYALQPSRIIVRYGLDVTTFVTTREHPAAEGGTVSEKCPGSLPKCRLQRYIFYMP